MSEKLNDVKDNIEVTLHLDKKRHLRFDLNAFAELEEVYDSVDDALKAMEKGRLKAVRAVLWAGLVHEDEDLTLKDVGRFVTLDTFGDLAKTLGEAIKKGMPRQDPNGESTQPNELEQQEEKQD